MASLSKGISQGCQAPYLWRVDKQLLFLQSEGTLCPASGPQSSGVPRDSWAGLQAPLPAGFPRKPVSPEAAGLVSLTCTSVLTPFMGATAT